MGVTIGTRDVGDRVILDHINYLGVNGIIESRGKERITSYTLERAVVGENGEEVFPRISTDAGTMEVLAYILRNNSQFKNGVFGAISASERPARILSIGGAFTRPATFDEIVEFYNELMKT